MLDLSPAVATVMLDGFHYFGRGNSDNDVADHWLRESLSTLVHAVFDTSTSYLNAFIEGGGGNTIYSDNHNIINNHGSPSTLPTGIIQFTTRTTTSAMGLGSSSDPTASVLTVQEKINIQIIAVVFGSVSVITCAVSLYWFVLMRRNFRRTLIMLLLMADLFKSIWFTIYPAVAISTGGVTSGSAFCSASGFFLQAGLESCDVAIFLMSLHMSFQVLSTNKGNTSSDGLYRYRYLVYAAFLILPGFDASLAFVGPAYLSQGALCALPIRPYWYRLALSWIPRYLVWTYVVFVAVRIYLHVGSGFKVFARKVEDSTTKGMTNQSDAPGGTNNNATQLSTIGDRTSKVMMSSRSRPNTLFATRNGEFPDLPPFMSEGSHEGFNEGRRPSTVRFDSTQLRALAGELTYDKDKDNCSGPSEPSSRRGSDKDDSDDTKDSCMLSSKIQTQHQFVHTNDDFVEAPLPTIDEGNGTPLATLDSTTDIVAIKRKRAIQRQVRLLFIYPCVYMILMIIPFVSHAMNYNDYYAAHPIYPLSALATFSYVIMGAADCIVFSWREKPWAAIPGSDGTFWGSFLFWRILWGSSQSTAYYSNKSRSKKQSIPLDVLSSSQSIGADEPVTNSKFLAPLQVKRPHIHRRAFSGRSDQAALAAERAAERLALERAEAAAVGMPHPNSKPAALEGPASDSKPKDWFDRRESWDLDDEDEDDHHDTDGPHDLESGQ